MVQIYFVIYAIPKQPLNYLKLHSLFNKKQYLSSFKKKLGIWRYQIWVLSVSYVLQNEILQHFHNLGMYTEQIRGKQYLQQGYKVNYNNQESSQKYSHNNKNKIQVYGSRRKFLAICQHTVNPLIYLPTVSKAMYQAKRYLQNIDIIQYLAQQQRICKAIITSISGYFWGNNESNKPKKLHRLLTCPTTYYRTEFPRTELIKWHSKIN
eukprot:TRINITY_DN4339_c1_g1_i3.p1 TRINITY_DN4339_c1_g1~~TRINITY_DN4339_c1_g1_i3.p1  ORF type:complete len:208 (-),score=-9.59 TRINITY_DN4339_c1_g1_i3:503-1126(-)